MKKDEAIKYLKRWFQYVDMQDLPAGKKKFFKKHPFLAPKDWEKDLHRLITHSK